MYHNNRKSLKNIGENVYDLKDDPVTFRIFLLNLKKVVLKSVVYIQKVLHTYG